MKPILGFLLAFGMIFIPAYFVDASVRHMKVENGSLKSAPEELAIGEILQEGVNLNDGALSTWRSSSNTTFSGVYAPVITVPVPGPGVYLISFGSHIAASGVSAQIQVDCYLGSTVGGGLTVARRASIGSGTGTATNVVTTMLVAPVVASAATDAIGYCRANSGSVGSATHEMHIVRIK